MTTLSPSDLASAASGAGFPSSEIGTAVAVAYAESGGDPNKTHRNTNNTTDYGLWQINSVHNPASNWADPTANAAMAYRVWSDAGGKWTPWATFNSGRYKTVPTQPGPGGKNGLAPNTNTPGAPNYIPPSVSLPNPLAGLEAVGSFFNQLSDPALWKRIGIVALGIGLVLFGLAIVLRTELTKTATSVVKGAIS